MDMAKKIINKGKVSIRSLFVTLVIFSILVYLGITIYNVLVGSKKAEDNTPVNVLPPSNTVQNLYNWYLNYKGNPVETGAYKFNNNLSTVFINSIDNRLYKNQLSYDPFVCSVDKPLGVSVISEKVEGNNAIVEINEDFGVDKKININLALEGDKWMVTYIDCPQIEEFRIQQETSAKTRVTLYFNNSEREKEKQDINNTEGQGESCGNVYDIERVVNNTADPLTTAIQELLKGPNKAEEILGYTSIFSPTTEGMLKELKIENDTAYIDLKDYRPVLNKEFTPCDMKSFKNSIEYTIKHYRENVSEIVFMLEGSKEDFNIWIK